MFVWNMRTITSVYTSVTVVFHSIDPHKKWLPVYSQAHAGHGFLKLFLFAKLVCLCVSVPMPKATQNYTHMK